MNKKTIFIMLVIIVVGVVLFLYRPANNVDSKNYVGYSVEECSRIQVTCVQGFERFDNEDGCGCEVVR